LVRGAKRTISIIALVLAAASISRADGPRIIEWGDVVTRTGGSGSIPGAILRDGTVCITATEKALGCQPIAKLPPEIVDQLKARPDWSFFDGIYDLDDSGSPEIFIDYWPRADSDDVTLLVYKKSGRTYREYMKLSAPTEGYAPGAWFIKDSPLRKAIFMTRCGGSSGDCLFYLDWKNRSLKNISDDLFLIDDPVIEDVDGDGISEIFVTARGYDRTSGQGAALLHWKAGTYRVWWPISKPPYVIYARLVAVGGDDHQEIIAVLDTMGAEGQQESKSRELAIWKFTNHTWSLVDKKEIAGVSDPDLMSGFPELSKVTPNAEGADIVLTYRDGSITNCRYERRKILCH
jgi:hypothetical protein